MQKLHFFALLLTGSSLIAQSSTLPKGWDAKDGTDDYGPTNSYDHSGWDPAGATTYVPARNCYLYDSSTFPWDATKSFVIRKLSVRRDALYPANASTPAHTKDVRVFMSTTTRPAHRMHTNRFAGNHGTNLVEVVGSANKPKTIKFPATPNGTATKPAPFNVDITLDKPFVVPANSKTLVIEIRVYKDDYTGTGHWRADSVRGTTTGYDGGSFTLPYSTHCHSPNTFYTSRANIIGSDFAWIWRNANPGKPMVSWIGKKITPVAIPGTNCKLAVLPEILVATVSLPSAGANLVNFGPIPMNVAFVGAKISMQSATIDASYNKANLGVTRSIEFAIGSGYASAVKGSQTYSYGTSNSRYDGVVNPDTQDWSRYFYRRVPIFKIN